MNYKKATVVTTSAFSDIVSLLLMDAGSEGTSIVDAQDVREVLQDKRFWDYYDDALLTNDHNVYVSGYFPESFQPDNFLSELENLRSDGGDVGSLECTWTTLASSDWENEWKKYYKPIALDKVTIVPKWLSAKNAGIEVLLDPGMAFGTGNHETTSMCIRLLQRYDWTDKTVFDVGCGSGILGITAVKLGAKTCLMSDIDDNAVVASRENAALNGVSKQITVENRNLLDGTCGQADCIVANITADILLQLYQAIGKSVKSGGVVIISGLIHARADEVRDVYAATMRLEHALREGEWQAFAFRVL